jgi:hypothetical protein
VVVRSLQKIIHGIIHMIVHVVVSPDTSGGVSDIALAMEGSQVQAHVERTIVFGILARMGNLPSVAA